MRNIALHCIELMKIWFRIQLLQMQIIMVDLAYQEDFHMTWSETFYIGLIQLKWCGCIFVSQSWIQLKWVY